MIKIFFIGLIMVLMITAFGISKLYFSSSSGKSTEAEKKSSSVDDKKGDSIIPSPVFNEKKQYVLSHETKPDIINGLKSAVFAENEFTGEMLQENTPACDDFIDKLIQNLNDSSSDNVSRKNSAKALIESGTKEGVLSVLKAIIDAHKQQDYDIQDSLIQIFADVGSVHADMLTGILTGKSPVSSDLSEMPEDLTYAINNVIRLMPNETVGEMLAQKYNAASEEEKMKLMAIKNPVMIARVAADAYGHGDYETANKLIVELVGVENNLAIKGMMLLAREQSISLDKVGDMMSSWYAINPHDAQTHFIFVEYLGNAEFNPEERSLAALAMVNGNDKEKAIAALEKAQLFEENPLVKENIDEALSRITANNQIEMMPDPDDASQNI